MKARLAATRARLDALDDALLDLLAERAALVTALWEEKAAEGLDLRDPQREAEMMARLRADAAQRGLDPARVAIIFQAVIGMQRQQDSAATTRTTPPA